MSFTTRQARVRVMELLEQRVRRFRSDEDLWPVRIPQEPLSLHELIRHALPENYERFDPLSLRARTLLWCEWDEASAWELWVIVLPSGLKVFCDSGADETRILATGGRHANDEAERHVVRLLAESAGERFGIEMSGGAPVRVRSSIADRDFLTDVFVHLFEMTGAEASVRAQLEEAAVTRSHDESVLGTDFRYDVTAWLELALQGSDRGPPYV